jgi:hypothetical protein
VGEPSVLRLDCLPFSRLESKSGQLIDLPGQLLPFRLPSRRVAFAVESHSAEFFPLAERVGNVPCERNEPRVRVQYPPLLVGPEKRLVRVLAVDVDQAVSCLPQLVDRRRVG